LDQDAGRLQSRFREAMALHRQGDLDAAERIYRDILAQNPAHFDATHMLGVVQLQRRQTGKGIALIRQAIAINGGVAAAHLNLGKALIGEKLPEQALAAFDRAIALDPALVEAHTHRADIMIGLRRIEEALGSYRAAADLRPDEAVLHRNCGHLLAMLRRHDEALAAYDRAFRLAPDLPGIEGHRLYAKMQLCDWRGRDADCAHLIASVRAGKPATQPFIFLAVASSGADQLQCARVWSAAHFQEQPSRWRGEPYRHERIRVAYLSADFRQHAASVLMAGMFEGHDRSRFEVSAISLGVDDRSPMRKRMAAAFEHFIDARELDDDAVADLLRARETDIAIDLMGYTTNSRTGIFARRPAPVQAHYMGFPGTMGAPFLDYIIADRIVIPDAARAVFSEKVVALPNSYYVNDATRPIAERTFTRAELGLPERGFVFCCFNGSHKVAPDIFDGWMRILKAIDGSALWLLADHPATMDNLRREAAVRGVEARRLVFASRIPPAEHLARHRAADLFLDTLPYNAHTTACDALWAGLPVLTRIGETFAGRVAGSVLRAIGLDELITETADDYERLAIALAGDPGRLAAVRRKLAGNRLTTPLFDTRRFTAHMEAAFVAMHRRHQAGERPDHIDIRP
jgi:predicted O-linked N-acetylglucosamine transferase (SPINDLY family)